MKKNDWLTCAVKGATLLLMCLITQQNAYAQTDNKRVIEKTFEGKTALWVSHSYGTVAVKKSGGTQTKVLMTISASGKDAANLQAFYNKFELHCTEGADNKLDIDTRSNICLSETMNGRSKISFRDGSVVSDIHNVKIDIEIQTPTLRYATIENKYNTIQTESDIAAVLEIILYDGKIDMPGNYNQLKLDVKYSDGRIGNFKSCEAALYDSDLVFGDGGAFEVDSRYSGITLGNLKTCKLTTYDDNYTLGSVSGDVHIEDKYSEFRFKGNIGNAQLELLDSEFSAGNADQVQITETKYTTLQLREVNVMHIATSMDDEIRLQKVGKLSIDATKYTEYQIGGLWKGLYVAASLDDEITVGVVGGTFEGMTFTGKYTEVRFPLPSAIQYELEVTGKYSEITYNEDEFETSVYKEKSDEISIRARSKGAVANLPRVVINTYDGDVRLN